MTAKSKARKKLKRPDRPSALRAWWQGLEESTRRNVLRSVLWSLLTVTVLAAGAYGMSRVQAYVLADQARRTDVTVRIRLLDVPAWLPNELGRKLASQFRPAGASYDDPNLVHRVRELTETNPWVARVVHIARHRRNTENECIVEVLCEYRRPAVHLRDRNGHLHTLADDGVRLNHAEVPKYAVTTIRPDGRSVASYYARSEDIPADLRDQAFAVNYPLIHGASASAPDVGRVWLGQDVADGMRLNRLMQGTGYASLVRVIDIRNHAGRIDANLPHLTLVMRRGNGRATRVLFGRFPQRADWVVPPAQKIRNLNRYVAKFGRLCGLHEVIDLRGDRYEASRPYGQ